LSTEPLTLTLPRAESFTLPCGIEVHVVTRPDALVGGVAVLGAGGSLGDGSLVEDDVVLVDLLERALDATIEIDGRGIFVHRSELAMSTITRAVRMVRALHDAQFNEREVTRVVRARTEERVVLRQPHIRASYFEHLSRLYGPDDARVIWNNPRRRLEVVETSRVNARLTRIMSPPHLTLVVVGAYETSFVQAALLSATTSWGTADHAVPRRARAPIFPPAHPQAIGYGSTGQMGRIALLEGGPASFAPDHAAYRVAVRLLGGMYSSRPNAVFREERRESYGARAAIDEEGGYSTLWFSMSVRNDQLDDALSALTSELSRLGHVESLNDSEVDRARTIELASEMHRFDSAEGIARAILHARAEGQTWSAYAARFEAIQRVTRDDVAIAALTWIRPTDAPIIVIGEGTWISTHSLSAPGGYELAR